MEKQLELAPGVNKTELFGPGDEFLRLLRATYGVQVSARGDMLYVNGEPPGTDKALKAMERMQRRLSNRKSLSRENVDSIIVAVSKSTDDFESKAIPVFSPKEVIQPFTKGQLEYVEKIYKNDLVFCTGPAGTGKTYLAVAVAASMLKRRLIRKIVLVRPAVEAGERLGFLPGDIEAKVNPYLRPLFDALEDMMDYAQMKKFIDLDIIEIIPLAFMRGRTLNDAVIICDEAQNTTPSQMMMFLTRLGRNSKMIVTGDMTQIDLQRGEISGLNDAVNTLKDVEGIGFTRLQKGDIVRHSLVQNIVNAYELKQSDGQ
jgi:phosphate starvation-inducible protein PhoH and related proteins